jgi:hypothetical protein
LSLRQGIDYYVLSIYLGLFSYLGYDYWALRILWLAIWTLKFEMREESLQIDLLILIRKLFSIWAVIWPFELLLAVNFEF